jgi:hypothetical protein
LLSWGRGRELKKTPYLENAIGSRKQDDLGLRRGNAERLH